MPKGTGFITSPKKALYNKIYRKTTFWIEDFPKGKYKNSNSLNIPNNWNCLGVFLWMFWIIIWITIPPLGIFFLIIYFVIRSRKSRTPQAQIKKKFVEAQKFISEKNYNEAIRVYKEAEQIDAWNYEVIVMLGATLHDSGEFKKAIEYLNKALSINQNTPRIQLILGSALYKIGDFNKAISVLQKIPDDFEDNLKVIQLIWASFASQKKFDLAIDVFKKAPLLKRNLDDNLIELHYNLAMIYEESWNTGDALKHYKKVYTYDVGYRDVATKIENLS